MRPSHRLSALAVLSALLSAGCAHTPAASSSTASTAGAGEDALREHVLAGLARKLPQARVEVVDADTLSVSQGEAKAQVNLGNTRALCAQRPDDCEGTVESLLENLSLALATDGEGESLVPAQVRAILKPRAFVEELEANARRQSKDGKAMGLLSEPWLGELVMVYVADLPQGMRMLTTEDNVKLGLQPEALRALALDNLTKAVGPLEAQPIDGAPGVFVMATGDAYDAARLLLPSLWAPLAEQISGRLVVVAPTRDVVLATGSDNTEGLAGLRQVAAAMLQREPYPLSATLLELTPTGWKPFANEGP